LKNFFFAVETAKPLETARPHETAEAVVKA